MGNTKSNRQTLIARESAMIAGVQSHLKGATLELLGQTFTDKQIVSALQSEIDAENAASAAKAALAVAVETAKQQRASTQQLLAALKQAVLAKFLTQPTVLQDFGVAPPKKRAPRTSAQLAIAAAKNKATREARGTVGPTKKKEIKGTVTSIELLPQPVQNGTNGSSTTTPTKA